LFVSSRTNRSSSSLFILLFAWVIFIFVIPKLSVMVSKYISPVPSVHEVNAQKDAFLQEIQLTSMQRQQEFFKQNPNDKTPEWQEKVRKWAEDLQQELTAKIDAKNKEFEDAFQAKRRTQEALALNISRISPASAVTFSALSLARTGIHEHERFLNSIKTYKPIFTKWVNEKMMRSLNLQGGEQPKPVLDDMPQFEFKPMSVSESFSLALPDLVILALMTILLFVGAFVSFLRYDIR